jgi:hypothetical protein
VIGLALVMAALGAAPQDPQERAAALSARLEELRGLRLKTPLTLRAGTRKEYAGYVLVQARRLYGEDLDPVGHALKTLGLVPPRLRLDLALTAQAGLGAKVFASGDEILLLDPAAGDEWVLSKMALALADQHFSPEAPATYDAQLALAALRMGDAEVLKRLVRGAGRVPGGAAAAAAEEARAWERGESHLASSLVPRIFIRTADFPWRRGAAFALDLHARGGLRALNEAWARPPLSTEQVLHPEKYHAGERPVDLDLAALEGFLRGKGWSPAWSSVLGELGTAAVLETHFPKEDAGPTAAGWGGDRLILFRREGAAPLAVWATEWDREEDAVEFQTAAFRLMKRLSAPEAGVVATAVRRGTSVFFAAGLPPDLQGPVVDAAWTCRRLKDGRAEPYGGGE